MAKGDFDRKMAEAMRGRYGSDELNNLLNAIVLVLLIINIFAQQTWLLLIALALVVCVGWRIMSKNVEARRNENELFLDHAGRFRPWLRNVRVPRGKGKLRVTCPKCHKKFEVKS